MDENDAFNILKGGKALPIGTKRTHGGSPVVKTAKGWVPEKKSASKKKLLTEGKATIVDRPDMEMPVYGISIKGKDKYIQRLETDGESEWIEVKKDSKGFWGEAVKSTHTYGHNSFLGYNKQEAIDRLYRNAGDKNISKSMDKGTAFEALGIEKGFKPGLVQKRVWVTRNGKVHQTTVWVREGDETSKQGLSKNVPVGDLIAEDVAGMNVERYSDKAVLITGDTYANKATFQTIKKEVGVGSFNGKLKGWVFPVKFLSQVLGGIASLQKDPDKADEIISQKNALPVGTSVDVGGEKGKISEVIPDKNGARYNVKTAEGDLNGVDEKVMDVPAETNNKKISEILNNTNESNRVPSRKQLFGIKPIENLHNYSLSEYMSMHGIDQAEIDTAIASINKEPKSTGSTSSGGSSSGKPTVSTEGLTKKQLIRKLVYAHYQAVSKAVNNGEKMKDSVLSTYPDLKDSYNKKRQAMSEETKRKISEALKKNKPEETPEAKKKREREEAAKKLGMAGATKESIDKQLKELQAQKKAREEANANRKAEDKKQAETMAAAKKAAEETIANLSEEEINDFKQAFKTVKGKMAKKEQSKLAAMIKERDEYQSKIDRLSNLERESKDFSKRSEYSSNRMENRMKTRKLDLQIIHQKNAALATANGGTIIEVTDAIGTKHDHVPDFSGIDTADNILYDEKTILDMERPNFIPDIDTDAFRRKGFIFDSIRVGPNKYMIAANGYSEESMPDKAGYGQKKGEYDPKEIGYVALTLDQLVLTQNWYETMEKGQMIADRDRKNKRSLDHWEGLPESTRQRYMDQKNLYHSIPAKVKKQITKEQWDAMPWKEREKLYKPIKKHGLKRLKAKFDDRHMASSFHSMYERFVDPNAKRKTKKGEILRRGQHSYGTSYAHADAWSSWSNYREMLDWKINDISIRREEVSEIRTKALETSYGKSGRDDMLKKDSGIMIKRQNGSKIQPAQVEQLKSAWGDVQGSFGTLKELANKNDLTISHAGTTYMYAKTAIGVYYPSFKAIGVTNKLGDDQLNFTFGHEVAHFLDDATGEGSNYASDNFESTAGQLAIAFRRGMNAKSNSKYTNSTKECFARALEQYHAHNTRGGGAIRGGDKDGVPYVSAPNYASAKTFNDEIKPLVEKFLSENKHIIKSLKWGDNLDIQQSFTILLG